MKKPDKGQDWVKHEDVLKEKMPTYQERRILAYGDEIMCVENDFAVGDRAPWHEHFHAQITYVKSGEFDFNVDGEHRLVGAGDSVYMAPHVYHEVICTKEGTVVDTFSPYREDFI